MPDYEDDRKKTKEFAGRVVEATKAEKLTASPPKLSGAGYDEPAAETAHERPERPENEEQRLNRRATEITHAPFDWGHAQGTKIGERLNQYASDHMEDRGQYMRDRGREAIEGLSHFAETHQYDKHFNRQPAPVEPPFAGDVSIVQAIKKANAARPVADDMHQERVQPDDKKPRRAAMPEFERAHNEAARQAEHMKRYEPAPYRNDIESAGHSNPRLVTQDKQAAERHSAEAVATGSGASGAGMGKSLVDRAMEANSKAWDTAIGATDAVGKTIHNALPKKAVEANTKFWNKVTGNK